MSDHINRFNIKTIPGKSINTINVIMEYKIPLMGLTFGKNNDGYSEIPC